MSTDKSAAAVREFIVKYVNDENEPTLLPDLTALISEHYTANEDVEKMVEEKCKMCKYRGLPDSIQEALNSGDGVYRP